MPQRPNTRPNHARADDACSHDRSTNHTRAHHSRTHHGHTDHKGPDNPPNVVRAQLGGWSSNAWSCIRGDGGYTGVGRV